MQAKRKVTYIISGINKSLAFEWIDQGLNKTKFDLSFILIYNGRSEMENVLKQRGSTVYSIDYKSKFSIPATLFKLAYFLLKIRPDVVHTHLFEATLFGSFISKMIGVRKRIQTRHHATSNLKYHPKTVKWDKYCCSLATTVVAPSLNVANTLILKENVEKDKVKVIHHGFNFKEIMNVSMDRIHDLRSKYDLQKGDGPIVGVISRYLELKGIQYIIPSFQKLLTDHPNAKLILGNAKGPYKNEIQKLLKKLPSDQYIEIDFENEIFTLYRLFDLFIHVPIDETVEAFGQIYIEALAIGIPSIFTMSGIANEFIIPDHNALVVGYENSEEIYNGMRKILSNDNYRNELISNGRKDLSIFELEIFIKKLEQLYE